MVNAETSLRCRSDLSEPSYFPFLDVSGTKKDTKKGDTSILVY